jgi:hypothetical protein
MAELGAKQPPCATDIIAGDLGHHRHALHDEYEAPSRTVQVYGP